MHLHRSSALGYASAASAAHSRVYGACAAEAAASESSGLSVGGCPERCTDFRPYPVPYGRGTAVRTLRFTVHMRDSAGRRWWCFYRLCFVICDVEKPKSGCQTNTKVYME